MPQIFHLTVEAGQVATIAGRLKAGTFPGKLQISTNFGRLKNEHVRSAERLERRKMLLQLVDEAVGSASIDVRDGGLCNLQSSTAIR